MVQKQSRTRLSALQVRCSLLQGCLQAVSQDKEAATSVRLSSRPRRSSCVRPRTRCTRGGSCGRATCSRRGSPEAQLKALDASVKRNTAPNQAPAGCGDGGPGLLEDITAYQPVQGKLAPSAVP